MAHLTTILEAKEKIIGNVAYEPNTGCWFWMGKLDRNGYGKLNYSGRPVFAHRLSYELFVGPVVAPLVLDHLCCMPCCVNPGHLEPVTNEENVMRGESIFAENARKTVCPSGHPYDDENTYVSPLGGRYCRRCRQMHKKTYRERHPEILEKERIRDRARWPERSARRKLRI